MRAAILALLLAAGCGDNLKARADDAAPVPDFDAAPTEDFDAAPAPDAGPNALAPCLDTPALRPPDGQLPCDLLPPGFAP